MYITQSSEYTMVDVHKYLYQTFSFPGNLYVTRGRARLTKSSLNRLFNESINFLENK